MALFGLVRLVSSEFYESEDNYTDWYEFRRVQMPDPRPCDQVTHLYTLTLDTRHVSLEFRGLWLAKVSSSNLILLVVNDELENKVDGIVENPTAREIVYSTDVECIRANGEQLVRRSYMECFNQILVTVSSRGFEEP